jgi:hypothetical protein
MDESIRRAREMIERINMLEPEWLVEQGRRQLAGLFDDEPEPVARDVVYKVYNPPQPQSATMDAEASARWNKWLATELDKFWDEVLVPEISEAMSLYVRKRLDEEIAKVRNEFSTELGSLRADVDILRCIIKGNKDAA